MKTKDRPAAGGNCSLAHMTMVQSWVVHIAFHDKQLAKLIIKPTATDNWSSRIPRPMYLAIMYQRAFFPVLREQAELTFCTSAISIIHHPQPHTAITPSTQATAQPRPTTTISPQQRQAIQRYVR